MALTNSFYEAVQSGDVQGVRIMMKDSLLFDRTFQLFNQMEDAAHGMKDLYDTHDNEEFNMDKSLWNDAYMNELMVQVLLNFSHERIDHLKKVVRYLKPVEESKGTPERKSNRNSSHNHTQKSQSDYQRQKDIDKKEGNYLGATIVVGAAVGATGGAVVSSLAGAPIAVGIVVGAVAGGTVAFTVSGRGKNYE